MEELVITAVGQDRPGLVDELTGCLHAAGANVADSRMINLRGRFAVILLAEVPDGQSSKLVTDLRAAAANVGLEVTAAPQTGGAAGRRVGLPMRVKAYAMDQPGIVHRITHLLHSRGVNIEELQTRLEPGSYTGTPTFSLDMNVTVPPSVPVKSLRQDLEALCDSLNCDIDIEPV